MRESDQDQKIIALVKRRGGWATKIHQGPMQSGTPDIMGCYKGFFIAFEDKVEAKVEPIQLEIIRQIWEAGGKAYVVYSVGMASTVLDAIDISCERLDTIEQQIKKFKEEMGNES